MIELLKSFFVDFQFPLHDPVPVFTLILLIILLIPLLLERLNIPGIIGLILAGVVVGPHGFNILEKNSAVDLFSTIGLLYIMFIAGLELDLNEFKSNKKKSIVFSLLTFSIPLSIGIGAMLYGLEYDINASILTASMFATHTLVAYPIVSKMKITKNEAVAVTVGGTIITDTAVLIVLAIILGNAKGGLTPAFWITFVLSFAVLLVIMFWIIPKIINWFFTNLEDEKYQHYVFVLFVVFLAAFLAEEAGLEPIIGAFFAGFSLNKFIPKSSPLMNRIDFIGNSLFIPFFLVSVGMLVDVTAIFSGINAILVALVLLAVAFSGKWLAAFFTQKIFHYLPSQRQVIFGLSGAHAAATLAVVTVGYDAGILDKNILNGTIILILAASIIAVSVTRKAAVKIAEAENNDEENLKKTARSEDEHILVSAIETDNLNRLVDLAILLKDKNIETPVSLLSVITDTKNSETEVIKAKRQLKEYIEKGIATEIKTDIRVSINDRFMGGVAQTSRELPARLTILDQIPPILKSKIEPKQSEKSNDNSFVRNVIFISHLKRPISTHKRLIILVPPLAEKEDGFELWIKKILLLSEELSLPIILFSNESSYESIKQFLESKAVTRKVTFISLTEENTPPLAGEKFTKDDLIIIVSARKGQISYNKKIDLFIAQAGNEFPEAGQIIIFPEYHPDKITEIETSKQNFGEKVYRILTAIFRQAED